MKSEYTYGITVSDDGLVLEFVRESLEGTWLLSEYSDTEWNEVNPEADEDDYPTLYDQNYYQVSPRALEEYIRIRNEGNGVIYEELGKYVLDI